jgi:Na+/glutamate symporter
MAEHVARGLQAIREQAPEAWQDLMHSVGVQGGMALSLHLIEDGTVEACVAGVPVTRVAYALVERGAARRLD